MSILFLAACSKEKGFELKSSKVDIVNDKSKTGTIVISDEHKETEIIPTSLYYEFEIKNNGKTIDSSDRFQIKVEPSAELSGEIQKIEVRNFFSSNGLGCGWGLSPIPLKTKENGIATVYFHLGTHRDFKECT
ncbi:hypothetical protein KHA94_05980 [Bacillus sp. FJAT-49705]|uniref:Lipoprotein n=1 Tax=Cytobacillus citreus TaxID=2833586 RepID=A0ABS5NQA9_9BACI|nr:hypothetical protein [Cytobacillus citreus]MBS4189756.1 hypothetical protein [Cytobacillus citreus]